MKIREEDMVTSLFVTDTHTPILFLLQRHGLSIKML